MFITHLGYLYSRAPYMPEEARMMAEETLKNPSLVELIMKTVDTDIELSKKITADRERK